MSLFGIVALILLGMIGVAAIIAIAFHAGYIIRDIRDRLKAQEDWRHEQEEIEKDTTPNIIEAKTPKQTLEERFYDDPDDSAILDPLTPKEIAEQRKKANDARIEKEEDAYR